MNYLIKLRINERVYKLIKLAGLEREFIQRFHIADDFFINCKSNNDIDCHTTYLILQRDVVDWLREYIKDPVIDKLWKQLDDLINEKIKKEKLIHIHAVIPKDDINEIKHMVLYTDDNQIINVPKKHLHVEVI